MKPTGCSYIHQSFVQRHRYMEKGNTYEEGKLIFMHSKTFEALLFSA